MGGRDIAKSAGLVWLRDADPTEYWWEGLVSRGGVRIGGYLLSPPTYSSAISREQSSNLT